MAAREEQDVSADGTNPIDDAVGARGDIRRRFPSGTSVTKQLPVGPLPQNVGKDQALVLAVIPLEQVGIGVGDGSESGQLA